MTGTDAPARANHLGNPCPDWCVTDHDHLLGNGKPQQNHETPQLYLAAGGDSGRSVSIRVQASGFSAGKPPVAHVFAYVPEVGAGLDVRCAEDARALSLLVLAVQQMHDGQIAELAAALDAMAALLPPESEL